MFLFVLHYGLHFKVYFVWYAYCNFCFPVLSIGMKYLSHPLTFKLYVSFVLKWVSHRQQIEGFWFFIQSATLSFDWGIQKTFMVIIDGWSFIAILNLIFQVILWFSILPFSFGWIVSICFLPEYFSFFVNVIFFFLSSLVHLFCYWNEFITSVVV